MRSFFYILAGITAALFGWNISLLVIDLTKFVVKKITQNPISFNITELLLFPILASCLSVSLVFTTIYLSNPTHYKANKRIRTKYICMALKTGLLAGIISGLITILIYKTSVISLAIRIISWAIIGLGVGLAEGLCWLFLSIEGANNSNKNRLIKSSLFGLLAGLIAAVFIELIKTVITLGGYEDVLGFIILGLCLGISLTFSTVPAYQVALRAGHGFGMNPEKRDKNQQPKIKEFSLLSIVYRPDSKLIEEGLSIQLPANVDVPIIIGSAEDSDIFIPKIPARAAQLTLEKEQWKISCLAEKKVQIENTLLLENSCPSSLYHNQRIAFYHEDNNKKFYRFIFYDRFLDPRT